MREMKLMQIKLLIAIVLMSTFGSLAQGPKPRLVNAPDLRSLLPKYLTAQGFLDPKFVESVSKPSRYYGDFYGIQALSDTTIEGIKRDFVPKFAAIESETENTIVLRFKKGWTGKFYAHASLSVMGIQVPFDHVEVSGATWAEVRTNLADFFEILRAANLEKRYLRVNPYYRDEVTVSKQLVGNKKAVAVPVATYESMQNEKASLLIYPETVHGNLKNYEKFKSEVLDRYRFDWVAMEMLTPSMQRDLDEYVRSADGSPQHLRTRKVLLDYFKDSWNGRAGPKTTAEENYYFKMVEQLRKAGTRVIGIEASTIEYIFFRYGENKFGGAVRSYWWVRHLPKRGKGLVFGGSAHFNDPDPINFQDFAGRSNRLRLYTLNEIKIRKQQ